MLIRDGPVLYPGEIFPALRPAVIRAIARFSAVLFVAVLIVSFIGLGDVAATRLHDERGASDGTGLTDARVQEALEKLPLAFIENRGQVDGRVAYYLQGRGTTVYFTSQGVTIALTGPTVSTDANAQPGLTARPVGFRPADPRWREAALDRHA